jgi:hypothetical protein
MIPQLLSIRPARIRTLMGVALLGLLTAACAGTPEQLQAGADPSDAAVRVPSVSYRPVLSGYASQRPVGPKPWREQNDSVAPAREK